jgi:selenocysteine lyase/cysteine desulfurase
MVDLGKIREQFPITKEKIYLAHASRGPIPRCGAEAIKKYVHSSMLSGLTLVDAGVPEDGGRALFAQLVGAEKGEVAFVENTSVGLNIAAGVVGYKKGSNVVTTDYEYSSVTYPFLRREPNVKVKFVKNVDGVIPLDTMEDAVDDKTTAIVVSHVHWLNGFRHDLRALAEIAHEHGAYLIVDAIQSAGAMGIDVRRDGVDFLTAGCYKWLLSPPGSGYLYVRRELIDDFEPPFAGWRSTSGVRDRDHLTLKYPDDARRFEVGAPAYISLVAATEAMKLLLDAGRDHIQERILMLTGRLRDALREMGFHVTTPEDASSRSGIMNFRVDRPQKVVEVLNSMGIIPCGARPDWARCSPIFRSTMRVAPHFYNTVEEIDAFVDSMREATR